MNHDIFSTADGKEFRCSCGSKFATSADAGAHQTANDSRIQPAEAVNHPAHYGGADNVYEAIKVIEAWGLDFNLGNCAKYLARAGKKDDFVKDLRKAEFYLKRAIENALKRQVP